MKSSKSKIVSNNLGYNNCLVCIIDYSDTISAAIKTPNAKFLIHVWVFVRNINVTTWSISSDMYQKKVQDNGRIGLQVMIKRTKIRIYKK